MCGSFKLCYHNVKLVSLFMPGCLKLTRFMKNHIQNLKNRPNSVLYFSAIESLTSVNRSLQESFAEIEVYTECPKRKRQYSWGSTKKMMCKYVSFRTVSERELFHCTVPKLLITKRDYVLLLILVII
jgi:hypothetical protein